VNRGLPAWAEVHAVKELATLLPAGEALWWRLWRHRTERRPDCRELLAKVKHYAAQASSWRSGLYGTLEPGCYPGCVGCRGGYRLRLAVECPDGPDGPDSLRLLAKDTLVPRCRWLATGLHDVPRLLEHALALVRIEADGDTGNCFVLSFHRFATWWALTRRLATSPENSTENSTDFADVVVPVLADDDPSTYPARRDGRRFRRVHYAVHPTGVQLPAGCVCDVCGRDTPRDGEVYAAGVSGAPYALRRTGPKAFERDTAFVCGATCGERLRTLNQEFLEQCHQELLAVRRAERILAAARREAREAREARGGRKVRGAPEGGRGSRPGRTRTCSGSSGR
jgi:hypothetical protein